MNEALASFIEGAILFFETENEDSSGPSIVNRFSFKNLVTLIFPISFPKFIFACKPVRNLR